jgi:hypothetical protein
LLSRYQYSDNKPGPFFCQDDKPPFAVLVLSLSRHHAPDCVFIFSPGGLQPCPKPPID